MLELEGNFFFIVLVLFFRGEVKVDVDLFFIIISLFFWWYKIMFVLNVGFEIIVWVVLMIMGDLLL